MKNRPRKGVKISRRNVFSIIGSSLLIPFLGYGKPTELENKEEDANEYQTLLKADGTTVKVKVSTLKKSKVVQKKVSNKSFLSWLGKKS